jgi:hypothetical protein
MSGEPQTWDEAFPPRLVIFPGETTNSDAVTVGHMYVVVRGKTVARYEVAGGPPPGRGERGEGGHVAGSTPTGEFLLDAREHHTTRNWPNSVVPWGAAIRESRGVVEYLVDGSWRTATGPHGSVTKAWLLWDRKSSRAHMPSLKAAEVKAWRTFHNRRGKLIAIWKYNDFGQWAWNLRRGGHRTPYYIHTTPDDEATPGLVLSQSHGCLHIRPLDRDRMMLAGYLDEGNVVQVMPYGRRGPP